MKSDNTSMYIDSIIRIFEEESKEKVDEPYLKKETSILDPVMLSPQLDPGGVLGLGGIILSLQFDKIDEQRRVERDRGYEIESQGGVDTVLQKVH